MTSLLNFINTQGSVDQSLLKYEYNILQLKNWIDNVQEGSSKLSDAETELLNKFQTQVNKLELELLEFKDKKLKEEEAENNKSTENEVEEIEFEDDDDDEEEEVEEEEGNEEAEEIKEEVEELEQANKLNSIEKSPTLPQNTNILEDGIRQRSLQSNNKSQNNDDYDDDDDEEDNTKEEENDPDLQRKLQHQESIQSLLTKNLLNMTKQLKSNTLNFNDMLKKDEQVLESASHHLETNLTQLNKDRTRLQKLNAESSSHFWRTFGVVIATIFLFIWTVVFIRIFPKLPEYR
ncbi:hypothetical protein CONCODRAFT_67668 [Conidiobolus coronatus NRRL 28638]|uniref:Uncharacterized protein n=1 Tax=Conidiobolus coronatus (strain ATCC 28846 / CBS 209.66 / NRRL 28638) TaxID=796925 RepID=A0A137PGZ4_CONC2|nr:hypothetical protein CONCODRAFT_67668 [Conidiobolus coronatus NRRL 28638]|eukprot:KXN74211.1 hypothetical protein CONCODRAFT_67668 [Conidiobolus coronatus NRRL 28638]